MKKLTISRFLELMCGGIIIVCLLLFLLFTNFFMQAHVPTESMEPTMPSNSVFLVYKKADDIQRNDIVVFYSDELCELVTKRVIGLPNERIVVTDGKISINGALINDLFYEEDEDFNASIIVPNNSYYLLGDNRNDSYDSRYWEEPFIDKSNIIGIVVAEVSPRFKIIRELN